jgi:hypothetical protein
MWQQIWLKHEDEFRWGMEQREAFNWIESYLSTPPVLRAPRVGKDFKLYISAQKLVIGSLLMQEDGGKEFVVAYLSRRLVYAEMRYTSIEKLCLSI